MTSTGRVTICWTWAQNVVTSDAGPAPSSRMASVVPTIGRRRSPRRRRSAARGPARGRCACGRELVGRRGRDRSWTARAAERAWVSKSVIGPPRRRGSSVRAERRSACVVERRLHRAGCDLQRDGDVGDGQVLHVVQRDHLALAVGERADGAPELGVDRRELGERCRRVRTSGEGAPLPARARGPWSRRGCTTVRRA